MRKLKRVLVYLKGTEGWIMKVKPKGIFSRVGGALVFFGSKKQKCVCKSPIDAELVALSDNVGFVELFSELVDFVLNKKSRHPPLIFQDNTLVIDMVTRGGGITRTRHMRTRLYLVLEVVKDNWITIRRIGMKEMKADGFTKCLDGSSFIQFRKEVLHLTD
jgi:hypothetical protein